MKRSFFISGFFAPIILACCLPTGEAQMRTPASQSSCAWGRSIRLCETPTKLACYGWRAASQEERLTYMHACQEILPSIPRGAGGYRLLFACIEFRNGTFLCEGALRPRAPTRGSLSRVQFNIRARHVRTHRKNVEEITASILQMF